MTIQSNWQHRTHNTKKKQNKQNNTKCVGHQYTQTNTSNINKMCDLLQTSGVKDEPNIVFMRNS